MKISQQFISKTQDSKKELLAKTYLLLTVGFVFMVLGVIVGFNFIPQLLALGKLMYIVLSLGITIITMFLALLTQRNILGYIFFNLFTFSIGFFDAPLIAVILSSPALLNIFKQAFGLTAVITASLTVYVLTTKKDFSFLKGFLFTGLIILLLMVFVSFFWHNLSLSFVMSGIGAVLFSGFILYDTSRLIYEKTTPVEIAINLFLDILNLFWSLFNLLKIISGED